MKKFISFIVLVFLVVNLSITAFATDVMPISIRDYTYAEDVAGKLKSLGLFRGVSDTDFDLDRAPTRTEAVVMLIRFLGNEAEVLAGNYKHPFNDVPEWADAYVGYAYQNKLTSGISATEFGGNNAANSAMFLTFMLRALGYTDKDGVDFTWDNPYELSKTAGILTDSVNTKEFFRADVAVVAYNALSAVFKESKITLYEKLIERGVFTLEQLKTVYTENNEKTNVLDGKKVIFIGNSFSYYGKQVIIRNSRLDQKSRTNDKGYFYHLCKEKGVNVSVTNWTFGGHKLTDTFGGNCAANRGCDGEDHLSYLTDRYFDYVVIQPGSANTDEQVNMVYNIMDIFKEANSNVKFVYVIPHRFHDSSYDKLINLADDLKDKGVIIVDWGKLVYDIIGGKAEVSGATEEYNRNTFVVTKSASDGYHPNMLAGYITTLMTYCAITGEGAEGQPYGFCTDSSLNSHFSVDTFLKTYYTYDNISDGNSGTTLKGDDLTTFPEVFKSSSDMLGIQKLIDTYLEK